MSDHASPPPAPKQGNDPTYSVSEISTAVKRRVETAFDHVRVRGEISRPKVPGSGHLYLTLKDDRAVLDAVCWRTTVARLGLRPAEGMEVICTGRLTTYAGQSKYQLVIAQMVLAGEGALLKLLEDRRKRLAAEGLFDAGRKRELPHLPDCIGVITSPTGAVLRDILHRLEDRFPRRVLVWPVRVQGERAAAEVTAALAGFDKIAPGGPVPRPDVVIVARGGGSLEDLMAFNEENVVRAAAALSIPLISAVGHETDTTLIDHAADRRAPTPTAAAEMAVPVRSELAAAVAALEGRRLNAVGRLLESRRTALAGLARGLGDPARAIEGHSQRLDDWSGRLDRAPRVITERLAGRLAELAARLPHPGLILARQSDRLERTGTGLQPRLILGRVETGRARLAELQQRADEAAGRHCREAGARLTARARLLEGLSYRGVLERGFAVVRDGESGRPLTRAAEAGKRSALTLEFADGEVAAAPPGPLPGPLPRRLRSGPPDGTQGSLL